jgi:hypothetical protein
MKQTTYYTVITGKRSNIVKYAQSPAYEIKLFSGSFADPGEAHKEFKCAVAGQHTYLTEGAFLQKIERLASRYRQDLIKLQAWTQGKPVCF